MAYTVNLYQFAKKQNSTAQPVGDGSVFQCKIKDGSNTLSPVILLDFRALPDEIPQKYNYAYIAEFERYYWITDISYRLGLWEFTLAVDVLASWKTAIGNYSGYVLRSAAAWDGNIKDTFYPAKTNVSHNIKVVNLQWADELSNGRYVVGVISGGNSNTGTVNYYVMTAAQFNVFCNAIFNNTNDWMDTASIVDISTELLKTLFNPMEYIVSVMWFPFIVPTVPGALTSIPLGWWQVPASAAGRLYSEAITFFDYTIVPDQHPQAATRGNYLNSGPYTTLSLDFQPFGLIPLDASIIHGQSFTLNVYVDYISGMACLHIVVGNSQTIIYSNATQVGVSIQISGRQPSLESMAASGIAMVADSLPQNNGGLWGDIKHVVQGLTGAPDISGTVSQVANAAATGLKRITSIGSNGNRAQILQECYLAEDYLLLTDEDNAMFGRPLYSIRQISTIPGYIQMGDAEIAFAGLQEEIDSVAAFLRNGFFYE